MTISLNLLRSTIQSCQTALVSWFEETSVSSMAWVDLNAVCTRDLADFHAFGGWIRPRVSGARIPFPKSTVDLLQKAAQSTKWHFDIEALDVTARPPPSGISISRRWS
jgi:hypothetical protein